MRFIVGRFSKNINQIKQVFAGACKEVKAILGNNTTVFDTDTDLPGI